MTTLDEIAAQLVRDIYYQTGPADSKAEMNLTAAQLLVLKSFKQVCTEQLEADLESIDVKIESLESEIEDDELGAYRIVELECKLEILEQVVLDLKPICDASYVKPMRRSEYEND